MIDNIERLCIGLDKLVWYPGEILKGRVCLHNHHVFKVRGIRVYLRGRGRVQWKVVHAGEHCTLKDESCYLDEKVTVWGIEKGMEVGGNDALAILPRGEHSWQFQFKLPPTGLPPSFESRTCNVRYCIRCIVDVPFASNPCHMIHFTLVGPYTDCMQEKYLNPTVCEITSRTLLCLPSLKPLRLCGTLERSSYCCGEHIKLRCFVANSSERQLRISVKLLQHCCFFINKSTHGLSKEFQHIAFEYRSELIPPHKQVEWDLSRFLRLPPMPPTVADDVCQQLSIAYTLRVHLVRDGKTASRMCLDFPVIIATLPFRIPNLAVPPVAFQSAVESVEGGMYLSPAFTLGQVFDGSEEQEDGILYQPLYATVMKNQIKLQRLRLASIANGLNDCAEKVSSV